MQAGSAFCVGASVDQSAAVQETEYPSEFCQGGLSDGREYHESQGRTQLCGAEFQLQDRGMSSRAMHSCGRNGPQFS